MKTITDIPSNTMKLTIEQAEKKFGKHIINKLIDQQAEPTDRFISPDDEPQHAGMVEYVSRLTLDDDSTITAYYYQPESAEDWAFGEMNGIRYGDIEYIETENVM